MVQLYFKLNTPSNKITGNLQAVDQQRLTKYQFETILKQRIMENAKKYLNEKKGTKGKENVYRKNIIADYDKNKDPNQNRSVTK